MTLPDGAFDIFDESQHHPLIEAEKEAFNRNCLCVTESPEGTEPIDFTDEERLAIMAEHKRLGRFLDTDEVTAIIGHLPYREVRQDNQSS